MEGLGGCDGDYCFDLLLADQYIDDQIATRRTPCIMMTLTMRNEDCNNSDEDDDSSDDDDNDGNNDDLM